MTQDNNNTRQTIGKGVTIQVKDNQVVITFALSSSFGPSSSGKSEITATTGGNILIPGTDVFLGLNAYRKR